MTDGEKRKRIREIGGREREREKTEESKKNKKRKKRREREEKEKEGQKETGEEIDGEKEDDTTVPPGRTKRSNVRNEDVEA